MAQGFEKILERKVSINVTNEPIKSVLKRLEDLGDFSFAYTPELFDVNKKITIDAKEEPLQKILKEVLSGEKVECKEVNNKIFIRRKKVTGGQALQNDTKRQPTRRRSIQPITRSDKTTSEKAVVRGIEVKSADTVLRERADAPQNLKSQTVSNAIGDLDGDKINVDTASKEPSATVIGEKMHGQRELAREEFEINKIEKLSVGPSEFLSYGGSTSERPRFTRVRPTVEYEWPEDGKREKAPRERKPKEEKKFRVFGASTTSYSQIGDKGGIVMGGRGALLLNKRFGVGLAGYAFQTGTFDDTFLSQSDFRYSGGYGGVLLEYTLTPDKPVHVTFPMVFGIGGAVYSQAQLTDSKLVIDSQAILVAEPGIELEFNVIKYVKMSFGATYRITSNATLTQEGRQSEILSSRGLNGLTAGCTVKFGIF